jgi:hypothetical protein
MVEHWEEEGEPLDEFDDEGLTWVHLLLEHAYEGNLRIGISWLMPRTFNFVPYNWEEISHRSRDGICYP